MTLVHLYPSRAFESTVSEINRVFDQFFGEGRKPEQQNLDFTWAPRVDVAETDNDFILTMEVPGISKKDFHIYVEDNSLVIEGERHRPELKEGEDQLIHAERWYGKFHRRFKIGADIQADKISAAYRDGLLSVRLPKAEKVKPKTIAIK